MEATGTCDPLSACRYISYALGVVLITSGFEYNC